ncbi:MAG: HupE/UreJ family protein [Cyanobacteria bacterium J06626_18]
MHSQTPVTRNEALVTGALVGASLLLLEAPALAHHPFGGKTPGNFIEGILSGMGHPVVGLDHLAFVIAAGLIAVLFNRGLMIPVAFVAASLWGTGIHLMSIDLPAPESIISASVLLFGVLLAMKNALPAGVVAALAAGAGLFHGYAYGEAIVGAEMSPTIAYLLGFAGIQMGIAVGAYYIAKQLSGSTDQGSLSLRFAGFTLAGVGAAFLSGVLLS